MMQRGRALFDDTLRGLESNELLQTLPTFLAHFDPNTFTPYPYRPPLEIARQRTTELMSSLNLCVNTEHERLTRLNHEDSPLLRLPAEIRNAIYELVFATSCVAILPAWAVAKTFVGATALLRTCRHMREDTQSLFFSATVFDLSWYRYHDADAMCELPGAKHTKLIRSVRLDEQAMWTIVCRWQQQGRPNRGCTTNKPFPALRHVQVDRAPRKEYFRRVIPLALKDMFRTETLQITYRIASRC
ncbi:hypothetical protein BDU57DRAFT_563988 [Ampelomyces quisqualis]|uniref:F-box domain-containing protein n=1 Tax=Ampelomyces quisqualis TaxID=50730 RepID=A0A6A5R3T6_AMPQU|nr:hypothetical protein BDU57DRAFT_563988 [Ampelomyces quisqualis]